MGVIAGLTVREAMRRRAFLGTVIILLALYGLSFLPRAFKEAFGGSEAQFDVGVNLAVLFGVDIIKFFSSVLAILLSAGAITAEIERGYLAAILPRPCTAGSYIWANGWASCCLALPTPRCGPRCCGCR